MDLLHGSSARTGHFELHTENLTSCVEKWLETFDKNEIGELKSLKAKNVAAESLRPEMIAAKT
jgi:hypothetical protein